MKKYVMVVLAIIWMSCPAHAAVIYDNSLSGAAGFGWNSNSSAQQVAEIFTLSSSATATDVAFHGFFHSVPRTGDVLPGPQIGAFDILFFDDIGGLPSAASFASTTTSNAAGVFRGQTATGFGKNFDIYTWTFSIPDVPLTGGISYWMSVRSAENSPLWAWSVSTSDGSGNLAGRLDNTGAWISFDPGTQDRQAFTLYSNEVPAPPTLLILGLGLAGIGWSRGKRA